MLNIVSVPSRGILFPNGLGLNFLIGSYICFRPLSGYLISKWGWLIYR